VRNTWTIYLPAGDNSSKGLLIPRTSAETTVSVEKDGLSLEAVTGRWVRGPSASWRGNGSPRLRRVAGLRGWSATLGLRHGPDSYGRQQWGILGNGRKPDPATPREWWRPSGRKALWRGTNKPANYRPWRYPFSKHRL